MASSPYSPFVRRPTRASAALALLLGLVGYAPDANADVGAVTEAVVYGADGRADVYAEPDPAFRAVATSSTLAVVSSTRVVETAPGHYELSGFDLGTVFDLCPDQRFVEQHVSATCSATLIDDDLVLTAGHCIHPAIATDPSERTLRCDTLSFVFDDLYVAAGTLATIEADDVYRCRRVVARHQDSIDFAIVQLDRPVAGRSPAPISGLDTPLPIGTPLAVIGHGSGLPTKIGTGGAVTHANHAGDPYLIASTDTFGGDSGAGVFDASHALLGVLVEGREDYVTDTARQCDVVNVLPEADGAESILVVHRAISILCDEVGYASARLCGRAPSCGDGQCTAGETTSCGADCSGEICGNGYCVAAAGESRTSCPFDCDPGTGTPSSRAKSRGCAVALGDPSRATPAAAWLGLLVGAAVLRFLARRRGK